MHRTDTIYGTQRRVPALFALERGSRGLLFFANRDRDSEPTRKIGGLIKKFSPLPVKAFDLVCTRRLLDAIIEKGMAQYAVMHAVGNVVIVAGPHVDTNANVATNDHASKSIKKSLKQ